MLKIDKRGRMIKPERKVLEKYEAYYASDTEFAAYARLLQSRWREKKGYKKGKLGNYLDPIEALRGKANFLTERIQTLVQYEVYKSRYTGQWISTPRIWENLLSSQPLCFNLFGEMHFDLDLASRFFSSLFPSKVNSVTAVFFEHSPGRGKEEFTGDWSAFDVFIEYEDRKGKPGFIGIEVKYAESLKDDKKKAAKIYGRHKHIYSGISNRSGIFHQSSMAQLKEVPLQQIWRDHLLSLRMREKGRDGFFVYLFPSLNKECQEAVERYKKLLISENREKTGFYPIHLEIFIKTLRKLKRTDWTLELQERYLGISL